MAEYWRFYEPLVDEINESLRSSLLQLPEWAPIIRATSPEDSAAQQRRSNELQRKAILDGDWAPYLQDLGSQGAQYARAGISFLAWFDVIAIYRETIRQRITDVARKDLDRAMRISDGMARLLDIAMAHLGEAYLATKEQIIATQAEALRELSLPILQVRDHLLIVPIVGSIDSSRARQLTENLLVAIRDRRARGVVLDLTGIPHVDSAIANYLVQTCTAAQLMGATVVITGISAQMAQTLVHLGAQLPLDRTHGDLQEGVYEIERVLGYRTDGGLA